MAKSGEIQLLSGRTIRLGSLRQWEIYAGLLEGLPTVESNARLIERLLRDESHEWGVGAYLIRPREQPIPQPPDRPYPFGTPAALPKIGCVGYFTCLDTVRDRRRDYSALVVVWFQDEYAFPIDPVVLEELRAVDWERLATDLYC